MVSKVVGVMRPWCLFPGAHLARLAPSRTGVLGGGGMAPRAPGAGSGRRHGLGGVVSGGGGGGWTWRSSPRQGEGPGLGWVGGDGSRGRSFLYLKCNKSFRELGRGAARAWRTCCPAT